MADHYAHCDMHAAIEIGPNGDEDEDDEILALPRGGAPPYTAFARGQVILAYPHVTPYTYPYDLEVHWE